MALVPVPPPPPPPLPVVKVSLSNNEFAIVSWPLTNQEIVLFAGNEETGVQVKIVLPALQAGVVVTKLLPSYRKKAVVCAGSIAVLNMKTTVVVVEIPVAPLIGTT